VGQYASLQKAALIASQLESARSRQWAAPLVASEWQSSDPDHSTAILQTAEQAVGALGGIDQDLQLRSIALAESAGSPEGSPGLQRAMQITEKINNPALRSWTQREIAARSGDSAEYAAAAQSTAQVENAVQQARLLREIGLASGEPAYFEQALLALQGLGGAEKAYALGKLAVAAGDAALVEQIDPAYPAARAAALLGLEQFDAAWQAALQIADPYEQGRAQAAIAAAASRADLASQIALPLYRDLALRDITRKTGESSLAQNIESPYYRVQALTAGGQFAPAWESAGELSETYPLVELASAWAQSDPQAALQVVDKIALEVDKAAALRAIAVASLIAEGGKDSALFERALAMALAARVRNDAISPARASLALALDFLPLNPALAQKAFTQAYQAAQRIAIK
jgi:hypothetical protein